jgi:hypothetical protein
MVYFGWAGAKAAHTSAGRGSGSTYQLALISAQLQRLAGPPPPSTDTTAVEHRRAIGIRLRGFLHTSPDSIPKAVMSWPFGRRNRALLDSLRREPVPSEAELRWARDQLAGQSAEKRAKAEKQDRVLEFLQGSSLLLAVLATLLAAATRGGLLLRAVGIAVVRDDGRPAPLGRVLLRSVITWFPFPLALGAYLLLGHGPLRILALAVPAALFIAGTVYAIRHPARSIQDRCAGTWLVPR